MSTAPNDVGTIAMAGMCAVSPLTVIAAGFSTTNDWYTGLSAVDFNLISLQLASDFSLSSFCRSTGSISGQNFAASSVAMACSTSSAFCAICACSAVTTPVPDATSVRRPLGCALGKSCVLAPPGPFEGPSWCESCFSVPPLETTRPIVTPPTTRAPRMTSATTAARFGFRPGGGASGCGGGGHGPPGGNCCGVSSNGGGCTGGEGQMSGTGGCRYAGSGCVSSDSGGRLCRPDWLGSGWLGSRGWMRSGWIQSGWLCLPGRVGACCRGGLPRPGCVGQSSSYGGWLTSYPNSAGNGLAHAARRSASETVNCSCTSRSVLSTSTTPIRA